MNKSNGQNLMEDILYMQALRPDEGYEVDFAVGTTFSLSMEGLVAAALGLSNFGEVKKDHSPMYQLGGISRSSEKFVIFCNKGSIWVPANCQPIYSLLEQSVIEVSDEEQPQNNFHPKIWIIRECSQEDQLIKVIITSRNLTFSTDLDAAIIIQGKVTKDGFNPKNKPLADMLRLLGQRYLKEEKKKKVKQLATDLERVMHFDFEEPLSPKCYEIHPLLQQSSGGESQRLNNINITNRILGKRILIISPFLDSHTSEKILNKLKAKEIYLVTNENNVTHEVLKYCRKVYVPKHELVDNDSTPVNLHAKMYLVEQENKAVYLYVGSANATSNGFHRNSELLIGVRINHGCTDKEDIFDEIMRELVTESKLYIQVEEPLVNAAEETERRKSEYDLERLLKWAMNGIDKAILVKKQKETATPYEVTLNFKPCVKTEDFLKKYKIDSQLVNNHNIRIRPLQNSNEWKLKGTDQMVWKQDLKDLSEFYVVSVTSKDDTAKTKSAICKVHTVGLEKHLDARNAKIKDSIITDDPLQYIFMCLSDFPEYTFESWEQRKKQSTNPPLHFGNDWKCAGLYEMLLKASYESPEKLEQLKADFEYLKQKETGDLLESLKTLLSAFNIRLKKKS